MLKAITNYLNARNERKLKSSRLALDIIRQGAVMASTLARKEDV